MLLYLKIKPGQRYDRVERMENEWIIRLKAPAIDGKANEHLVKFMSEILKVPKSSIEIIKGHTSRFKCLEIKADENNVNALLNNAIENLHNSM